MIDSQAVAWALIHSIWQGLFLALAFGSLMMVSRSARLRYFAGLAVMALMLAMFVVTLAMSVPETAQGAPRQFAHPGTSFSLGGYARRPLIAPADPIKHLAPYLSVFWAAGVCACHLWQLAGLVWVHRLRRRGVLPVIEQWQCELRRLGQTVGVTRSIRLVESLMVNTPMVVGHLRPLILLPAGLLARLPVAQIEAILLHELSHIRRCDFLVNLIQRWVEGVFFYHPAMWWISRVVRFEREACCDEMAAAACGNRHTYASALAALEEGRFISPALAATGSSLPARIERLLRENAPPGARGVVSCMTILVTTSALAVGGWQANRETPLPPPSLAVKEALANQPSRTAVPAAVLAQARPAAQRMAAAQQPVTIEGPYRKWLNEDVVYLITDVERAAFDRLKTDEERQMFIEQFWQRRNALTPSTSGRSAKEEHYRRVAYANDRFAAGVPGWRTDRGHIYIVLGPPSEIEAHPTAQGGRPAYEVWRYSAIPGVQPAQFFTFADVNSTGDYKLQTTQNGEPAVFNRVLRWAVSDPLNRFVTGLTEKHFILRENGVAKPFMSFESPGSPTAIAVVCDADLPDLPALAMGETVIQTRTLEEALARLQSSGARRKALIIVRGAAGAGAGVIPGGILGVVADAPAVPKWIVEIANQYVASYRSDSPGEPELIVKPVQGMPPLRIAGPVR